MESKLNGRVTYLALQRLAEKAWDEQDEARLHSLSAAVDRITIELMEERQAGEEVV